MDSAAGAVPARSANAHRTAEDGIWHSPGRMAAWAVARLGRDSVERKAAARCRIAGCTNCSPILARTSRRQPQLAISALGRVDARSLARALGLIIYSDLMPTAHQNGCLSENVMSLKPARARMRSISLRRNRFSRRVQNRS